MENIDRRGFFASLGAALLAPFAKLENKISPLRFSSAPLYDIVPRAMVLKEGVAHLPGSSVAPYMVLGKIEPYPSDLTEDEVVMDFLNVCEKISKEKSNDPFQTFQVDTSNV